MKLGREARLAISGRCPVGLFESIGAALVTKAAASREVDTSECLVNLMMLNWVNSAVKFECRFVVMFGSCLIDQKFTPNTVYRRVVEFIKENEQKEVQL